MCTQLRFGIAVILAVAALPGCERGSSSNANTREAVRDVDARVRPYDSTKANEPARRHYAFEFRIDKGVLAPQGGPAEIRPGNPPYRPPIKGGYVVVYRDAAGKELGRYTMEDPGKLRSCDTGGSKPGEVRTVDTGRVEILVPYLPNIAMLELGPTERQLTRYDVTASVERATAARPSRRD